VFRGKVKFINTELMKFERKLLLSYSFYMVRTLAHPDIGAITVAGILRALADPFRLAIVAELVKRKSGLSCTEASAVLGQAMAKSTCSLHYRILRESGLIACRREGTQLISRVQTELLEARFPGLLASILDSRRKEGALSKRRVKRVSCGS